MNKIFSKDGRIFLEVTPVKSLFNSGMIHDVITTGGKFVVDLNTCELTIYREKIVKNKIVSKNEPNRPRYKPNGKPTVKISEDFDIAQVQLADQYWIDNNYGVFYYGPSNNRRKIKSGNNWANFIDKVQKFYKG